MDAGLLEELWRPLAPSACGKKISISTNPHALELKYIELRAARCANKKKESHQQTKTSRERKMFCRDTSLV